MTDIVTIDIGGTHARFAIASIRDHGTISLSEPNTLKTKDHASFQSAWEAFRTHQGGALPDGVAMAIAGPLNSNLIRFTNNPWSIGVDKIASELKIKHHTIVNDFAAVAHAVAHCDPAHFLHLAGPDGALPSFGATTVLGPGTGLGVALLLRDARGYCVQATEGGHIDFAPHDAMEDAILALLRKRHSRVSVERVVSGPAIVDIYATIAASAGRTATESTDIAIWAAAIEGSDSLAVAALDRFCMVLGSAAGDLALAHGANSVVIAGGLGYRLRDHLTQSAFADRFLAKGRFANHMASIPVKLIAHPQPGLLGAAAAYAREHLS